MLIQDHPFHLAKLTHEFTLPDFAALLPSLLVAVRATSAKQMALAELHVSLLTPFQNGFMKQARTDTLVAKVAAPQSAAATIAAQMLIYGYCSHYFTGHGPVSSAGGGGQPALPELYAGGRLFAWCDADRAGDSASGHWRHRSRFTPAVGRPLSLLTASGPPRATLPVGEWLRFSVNPLLETGATGLTGSPSDNKCVIIQLIAPSVLQEMYHARGYLT